ncbi:hypothetical protein [Cupriavidus sp. BIC8F]|uniref:hypothetical protein n=1 Tax=Cupriavidus sp. BIC8F TaxID=3079014 RepID=UPI002916EC51|nr:hypothetical protein [Cupriavidus sp. BIC8F]
MNCKIGDLAFIVRDEHPENIGRLVRVVGPARWVSDPAAWHCEVEGAPLRMRQIGRPWESIFDITGDCCDADLRPISGVPVHDEQLDEVTA